MAEQTFKSPGFFEREIEVISRPITRNTATPVGIVGTSQRGPAFVPTTVTSREEFIRIFGAPHKNFIATQAAAEFFRNDGKALTFCRALGTGHGSSASNAGFKLVKTNVAGGDGTDKRSGTTHFIAAQHTVSDGEFIGLGVINDNDSLTTNMDTDRDLNDDAGATDKTVELIRAMILTTKDCTLKVKSVADFNANNPGSDSSEDTDDVATAASSEFVLCFDDAGTKEFYRVSLDPSSQSYISNVLNTDPHSFEDKKHYLYAHFSVDTAVAAVAENKVAVLHGTEDRINDYNNFQSDFRSPKTTSFISQPFGQKEYDLFHFESLDDGAYANSKYKISISNLAASTDPTYNFGTFTVTVRDLADTDDAPIVYESFNRCSLDPTAENFIGRVIGDQKLSYDYKANSEDERRLLREGSYPNRSQKIRVVVSDDVLSGEAPETSLPFGFRGIPALLTTDNGKDGHVATPGTSFLTGVDDADDDILGTAGDDKKLSWSVLPPLPYRFKITSGSIKTGDSYEQTFLGEASSSESLNLNYHWGLTTTRVSNIDNANYSTLYSDLSENYSKMLSASVDVVSSGELSDTHNNNKFSLAKVALPEATISELSGNLADVFKNAVYVRNAELGSQIYDSATHQIKMNQTNDPFSAEDGGAKSTRATLAKLLAEDPKQFNKFSIVAKFTAPFYGGFDGLNLLDQDSTFMTDRSASTESDGVDSKNGKAGTAGFSSGIKGTASGEEGALMQGSEDQNNIVSSYKNALTVMTDEMVVNHNVLALPSIRDPFITDFAKRRVEDYGKALYVMDIPQYNESSARIYVDIHGLGTGRPDVDATSSKFDLREVNSSYVSTYFPDAKVLDSGDDDEAAVNSRRTIKVPPSVVALGALAKTDSITQPWFAPAGFSRGALESIRSIDVRLNAEDRDTLYENRINPIANFPNKQFVIFGQKTTQLAQTSLDRVNVRRLVLEVKRRIELIAQSLLFAQNNKSTRDNFVRRSSSSLSDIQLLQGIEDFRVIMDETNNKAEDVDNNRMNGKIVIVPTRAVEFIAIDFVITNAGVEFP